VYETHPYNVFYFRLSIYRENYACLILTFYITPRSLLSRRFNPNKSCCIKEKWPIVYLIHDTHLTNHQDKSTTRYGASPLYGVHWRIPLQFRCFFFLMNTRRQMLTPLHVAKSRSNRTRLHWGNLGWSEVEAGHIIILEFGDDKLLF
jgi:hypothetical protein